MQWYIPLTFIMSVMPSQIYKHYDGLQLNPTLFATQHHHLPQTSPTTYHHSTTISLTHHYNTTTSSLANHFAFAFTNHFPQIPPPGTTSCPTPLYALRRGSPRPGHARHTRQGLTMRGTGPPHPPGTRRTRDRAATPARDSPHAGRELTRGHTSPSGPWVQLQKNVSHRNSAVQYLQGACRIPQSPICGDSAANSRQASASPAALLNSAPRTSRSVHYGCRRFHSGNVCQVSNVWYR